jgi:hypothetical protein
MKDAGETIAVLKAETELGELMADMMLLFTYYTSSSTYKISKAFRIDQYASSVDEDCITFVMNRVLMIPNNKKLAQKQFVIISGNTDDGQVKKLDFLKSSIVGVRHMKYAGFIDSKQHFAFGGSVNSTPSNSPMQFADEDMALGFITSEDLNSASSNEIFALKV